MSGDRTAELLARPSPDDYGADIVVDSVAARAGPESGLTVVAFRIAGELLALDAARVAEVQTARPVRRVPRRTTAIFLGLVNVRGQIEPCVSLGAVLGLDTAGEATAKRLVVFGAPSRRFAFRADDVALRDVPRSAVLPAPTTLARAVDHHTQAVITLGGLRINWLDAALLAAFLTRSLG